jgi:tetratricopeptide (TPR) repeat protein
MPPAPLAVAALLAASALAPGGDAGAGTDPATALERAMSTAEGSLRDGEVARAESQYRSALREAWLLMGALESTDGRRPQAEEAFRRASTTAAEARRALPSLASLPAPRRLELKRRVRAVLARAYLNLGVIQAKSERFAPAAELLEKSAEMDPDLPQVQYSLGVAYFNGGRFDKATAPLSRALAASPRDASLKRMLAMAWLNTKAYDKAAELLRDDAQVNADPSLQFAYGLALVKSDRAAEAERVFSQLVARHGDSAELSVLLGQAYAQQGEFDSARESLRRALQLKPGVAEANATLGEIYLRQGRLAEAEEAFRAELREHSGDVPSQQNLAIVLDAEQRAAEAIPLLRRVVTSEPERATARYLLGKILLAQGDATAALEHLEAAARQAPEDAKIRYQLGQAYQRLGRPELAEQQFELFRQLKARH